MCNTWGTKQEKKCVAQDESIHTNYHREIKTNFAVCGTNLSVNKRGTNKMWPVEQ